LYEPNHIHSIIVFNIIQNMDRAEILQKLNSLRGVRRRFLPYNIVLEQEEELLSQLNALPILVNAKDVFENNKRNQIRRLLLEKNNGRKRKYEECVVCTNNTSSRLRNCQHTICIYCVCKWIAVNKTCPVCRQALQYW